MDNSSSVVHITVIEMEKQYLIYKEKEFGLNTFVKLKVL